MASKMIVPVVKISNVHSHPNADNLDIAEVLGYQVVVRRGQYKDSDLVLYIPSDALLTKELAEKWKISQYLKGPDKNRVGRIRLRGEPSFGLIIDCPEMMLEGTDMSEFLGIVKYEPPVRATCGDAAPRDPLIDPFFDKFTDVQNGRIFVDVLKEGEEVICTEKIHGTSGKISLAGKDKMAIAGSMEVRRKRPFKIADGVEVECDFDSEEMRRSTYWFPWTIKEIRDMLNGLSNKGNVILYGEIYGGSIQSLDYGIVKGKGLGFRAFGLKVDGRFLDWDEFEKTCATYGVKTVPVLWRGPFSMAKAKELADGMSTMAGHIREGTVIYVPKEREHPKIGRVILKYIGTEYALSKHQDMDTKDV